MFGETTIFYIKIWTYPTETSIYKRLFRVPGRGNNSIYQAPLWRPPSLRPRVQWASPGPRRDARPFRTISSRTPSPAPPKRGEKDWELGLRLDLAPRKGLGFFKSWALLGERKKERKKAKETKPKLNNTNKQEWFVNWQTICFLILPSNENMLQTAKICHPLEVDVVPVHEGCLWGRRFSMQLFF